MSKSSCTIISINIINHRGRQLFQDRWYVFVDSLREGLQQAGIMDPESKENLLLFTFNHPFTALASCLESIEKAKKSVSWKEEYGQAPIQIVMHLENPAERYDAIYDVGADLWNFLKNESIYLSRTMKAKWPQLMDGRKLPALTFDDEMGGVYLLKFKEIAQIKVERLFPYRQLALSGREKECFYCGRNDHIPAKCPSKYLNMDDQGLRWIGYMHFSKLSNIYRDVFSRSDEMLARLASGIEPGKISNDPAMQVYLAYFDLFRVYQPRFLHHISFTKYLKWEEIGKTDRIRIDNNNLNLGFDCLRVHQYSHAQKWLSSDSLRNDGKEFHASVGLAFLALEQGREKDMGTLLERASDLADCEKNSIYISLLLARHYHLANDLWKADQEVNSVLSIHNECAEAKFAKIKIGVSSGFKDQAFAQVVSLVKDSREFFMAALIDSGLTPIQGLVEEALGAQYENLKVSAKESFAEVNKAWEALNEWLGDKGEPGQDNINSVKALQKHFDRGTYYDLLMVQSRSKAVVAACHRLRQERVNFLNEKANEMLGIWEGYHSFWLAYPYQGFFTKFIKELDQYNASLVGLQKSVKNDKTLLFSDAMEKLAELRKNMDVFKPQVSKMIWVRETMGIGKNFLKKLLLLEVTLNILSFVALTFFSTIVADILPENARHLLSASWFQKKTYMMTSFLVAPIFTVALVILDNTGKSFSNNPSILNKKIDLGLSAEKEESSHTSASSSKKPEAEEPQEVAGVIAEAAQPSSSR